MRIEEDERDLGGIRGRGRELGEGNGMGKRDWASIGKGQRGLDKSMEGKQLG